MDAATFFTSPFAIAGLTAIATLTASLGSQAITARANLKSKRLELSYARKADAYQNYLVEVAHFIYQPQDEEKHRAYLKALMQAKLVASIEVYNALDGPLDGAKEASIDFVIRHTQPHFDERFNMIGSPFYEKLKWLQELMRQDLNRLGGL